MLPPVASHWASIRGMPPADAGPCGLTLVRLVGRLGLGPGSRLTGCHSGRGRQGASAPVLRLSARKELPPEAAPRLGTLAACDAAAELAGKIRLLLKALRAPGVCCCCSTKRHA